MGFRENYQRFVDLGATLLGLSVESNRAHTAFAESLKLPFPLLSDLNREVVQAYGVMYTPDNRHREGFYGLAKRSVFVLDKDGIVEPLPPPGESDYLPKPPTAQAFFDCCNEFWWVCPYVAKGLWREEVVYAKYMHDRVVREQLMKMLTWHVGVKTQFSRNPGYLGKNLKQYLEPELWAMLEKTYSDAGYDNTWDALLVTCDLFRLTANRVAEHFGFEYPRGDDERVTAHLRHVRALPKDARELY